MSVHSLGHVETHIPGIDPSLIEEADTQKKSKGSEDAQVLDSILGEDFSLFSWGETRPLKITRNGKPEWKRFRIKSVGIADIMEAYQERMPSPPAVLKAYKKDTDVARQLGQKHDVVVWEVNEADPAYLEMKRKHETAASQEILLRGLAHDLQYKGRTVLSGSDIHEPSVIVDHEGAMTALRRMGLTAEHFSIVVADIRSLTADHEVEETKE